MNKKFGPAPNWLQTTSASPDREAPSVTDPLKSLFSASRNARLGDENDDVLLEAYRESLTTITDARLLTEIKTLIGEECRQTEPFGEIYVMPVFTGDVPDLRAARLVVLNPQKVRATGTEDPELNKRAHAFLDYRGAGPRTYRNALCFVVADTTRFQELESDLRAMLAWQALSAPGSPKRLEPKQTTRARAYHAQFRERIASMTLDTFSWLLVPAQAGPEAALQWLQLPLSGSPSLAQRAATALKEGGHLRTEEGELAEDIARARAWLGDRVNPGQLAEECARHLYLPRVNDDRLLHKAIQLALSAGLQGRPVARMGAQRPFAANLPIDAGEIARNTHGVAAELLAHLLTLDPDALRVTLQIEAQVTEEDRQHLETLLRSLRKKSQA